MRRLIAGDKKNFQALAIAVGALAALAAKGTSGLDH
jgi:hypothetical protein